jgi:ribonuclease BN (tRNA processing enzyme)
MDDQREIATAYAHSTIGDSLELAQLANVKHLVLFHHAPNRTDAQLDELAERFVDTDGAVSIARESDIYELPDDLSIAGLPR